MLLLHGWAQRGLPVLPCCLVLILFWTGISAVSHCGATLGSWPCLCGLNQHPSCTQGSDPAWTPLSPDYLCDLPWFEPFLSLRLSRKRFSTPCRSAGTSGDRQPRPPAALCALPAQRSAQPSAALAAAQPAWWCPCCRELCRVPSPAANRGTELGDPSMSCAMGTSCVPRPASRVLPSQKANKGCWALPKKSLLPSVCVGCQR